MYIKLTLEEGSYEWRWAHSRRPRVCRKTRPRGRKSGIGWIKARWHGTPVVSLMKCSLARLRIRGRVYYYIRGRGSHCQTAAARAHNYINRDIPRPLRIHLFPRQLRVSVRSTESRLKACLRVCLRWLAYGQQKLYVSSNNDTRRVNSHWRGSSMSTM